MLKRALFIGAGLLAMLAGLALWLDSRSAPGNQGSADPTTGASASPGVIYAKTIAGADGRETSLGRWADKLLVLNFWATWCSPCREEIPILNKMQRRFAANGLQIVGIAVDSDANVSKFLIENPLSYPVFSDPSGGMELSKRLGNRFGLLPFTVVIQPGGNVLLVRMGMVDERQLEEIAIKNSPNASKIN
jgi:thiol-disulfide isomerase/thioredoxin